MSQRICLVTAEFHGLFKNGGIGTANTGLAMELAAAGHAVTVAYVDPGGWSGLADSETFRAQRARWRDLGINLEFIPRWPRLKAAVEDFCWSLSAIEYLRARRFDVVLFNECGGQGYFALLAKRAGVFADAPHMIVVTHGASDWARELNAQLPHSYRAALLAFFERRSVELADVVVSPSAYLIGWMRDHGWRLPEATLRLQNIIPAAAEDHAAPAQRKIDEIVFFGRLESRKGIEIFCDAIAELDRAGRLSQTAVTFLGKFSRVGSVHSGVFIIERSQGWSVAPRILADLAQEQALDYLKRPGVLAVIPSLAENSPCVVAECLIASVPFLATESGGTAELVAAVDRRDCLVAPQAQALAARLDAIVAQGHAPARMAEPQSDTRARWRALVAPAEAVTPAARRAPSAARVSVCFSLPACEEVEALTLESIRGQTHADIEIVIAAYGGPADRRARSQDQPSQLRLERASPDRAAARNAAAAEASGDWLMFARETGLMLEPEAIATLLGAAERLNAEAICGFAYEHGRPGLPSRDWDGEIGALPFGPALEVAAFENVIGDDVFLITRRAFDALGGYESGVEPAIEDRLLLTRALAAGVGVDLTPAPVAWLRAGARNSEETGAQMRRVLDVFRASPLSDFSHALESVLSQGPHRARARADAWLAHLDGAARDLALKLTFNYAAGGPESFAPFLRYCLARGRVVEALDFARRHDAATLTPIAEAAVARQAEHTVRALLRAEAGKRQLALDLKPEIVERLRLIGAPSGVTIQRDAQCVASLRLLPGLTVAKAPLACPPGAERLESYVDFTASSAFVAEIALAAAEPSAHGILAETDLVAREGFWWSGWRRLAPEGVTLAIEALPPSPRARDIYLLCRTAEANRGDAWSVWRNVVAQGSLSSLFTPGSISASELRYPLPLHFLEAAEITADVSDFPYSIFTPGTWTLHHPMEKRLPLVRLKGAVPAGAVGVRASFSVEHERAHPIAFGFWIRQPGEAVTDEAGLADSAAFSGWTLCPTPFEPDTGEARLAAAATGPMDLYLATKVVGFDDVAFCHAGWREISVLEPLLAPA